MSGSQKEDKRAVNLTTVGGPSPKQAPDGPAAMSAQAGLRIALDDPRARNAPSILALQSTLGNRATIEHLKHIDPPRHLKHLKLALVHQMVRPKKPRLQEPSLPTVIEREAARKKVDDEEYTASGGAGGTGGLFDKSLRGTYEENERVLARIARQKMEVETGKDVTLELIEQLKHGPEAEKEVMTRVQAATAMARMKRKEEIADPDSFFTPEEITRHLGKFANGAHAFIDPHTSAKIEGKVRDPNFTGWGRDANFVAPLDEANALNAKAHRYYGIVTLEDDLGIADRNWSRNDWNKSHEIVRWIIPRPRLVVGDDRTERALLRMATGRELSASSSQWVAGGFTKGGVREAKIDAIPRADLVTALSQGDIRQKIEEYPETPEHQSPDYKTPAQAPSDELPADELPPMEMLFPRTLENS